MELSTLLSPELQKSLVQIRRIAEEHAKKERRIPGLIVSERVANPVDLGRKRLRGKPDRAFDLLLVRLDCGS